MLEDSSFMTAAENSVKTIEWVGGLEGHLRLLDQTRLPVELAPIDCRDVEAVLEAIAVLRVRGAPAIGIAAAYGVCLGLQAAAGEDKDAFSRRLDEGPRATWPKAGPRPSICSGRWTACAAAAEMCAVRPPAEVAERLLAEARAIHVEDRRCATPSAGTGPRCWPTGKAC